MKLTYSFGYRFVILTMKVIGNRDEQLPSFVWKK